jgi:predicted phosphoribosyltransferase
MKRYEDRREAGQHLAKRLATYFRKPDTLILALPRGGVPVAYEIALALDLPLDLMLVRKLGVPGYRELAMGAIATGGVRVLNKEVIDHLGLHSSTIDRIAQVEEEELLRRSRAYRGNRARPFLQDKTILLVDDGMATGANMRAAAQAVRGQGARHIVIATPVASESAIKSVQNKVDEIICSYIPREFYGVGGFYENFAQTSDEEVIKLLSMNARSVHAPLHA